MKKNDKPTSDKAQNEDGMPVEIEERLKWSEDYFKYQTKTNPSFVPEYEAAVQIKDIVLKENISTSEIKEIVQIFNKTNEQPHYNGSGWVIFRITIEFLIREHNMEHENNWTGNIKLKE